MGGGISPLYFMRTVKFTEDFKFNVHGGAGGQTFKKAGEVYSCNDWLADQLVNFWEKAKYHDMRPQETKPASPTEQKATYTKRHKGGGFYEIIDEDGDAVDTVRGKDNANDKLQKLNG